LALARIRLVGFHNFVDETIEISTGVPGSPGRHSRVASAPRTTPAEIGAGSGAIGGHLFLLGDNGSGKTTVLDAIHLALTGGDIELNAAARVGGRRHEGRSLAGIVLRQGPSGIVREGSSIAYVALELASTTERYVIGIGLGATTLQAMVSRWGIVRRGALEDVAFTIACGSGERPRTQSELASALGPSAVLGRIGEYRARVAELLFGGDAAYERACRLWSIAKAYRELVLGTRDPGALFERFLPPPASEVLDSVQKSLHQLDELEASLRGLETRRACVAGVAACRAEILAIRRERERLDHTELVVREGTLRTELRSLAAEREEVRTELARCAARLAHAEERAAREEGALRALTTGDAAAWARDLSTAERDRDARRTELACIEAARDAALARRDAAVAARTEAERALEVTVRAAEEELRAATEDASRLPTLLPRCAAASSESTKVGDAQDELQGALRVARMALTQAELRRHELERAGSQRDEPSDTDAAASLLEALRHARIEAAHLFELLEPHPSADLARLAALEAAVPLDVWRTVVTTDEDLVRARAALAEHPGARLLVQHAATPPALLPSWVLELFEVSARPLAKRALVLLAHELVQVGPLDPPDALGGITLRGSLVRAGESPTLLGSERRARARMLGLRSREARASEEDAARASAEGTRDACAAHVERLVRVERALHRLTSAELRELRFALAERQRDLDHASEAALREEKTVLDARARLRDVERTVEVLRDASARGDRAQVAREIGAATEAVRAARSERDSALEARVRCTSRDAGLAEREDDVRRRLDETISTLERAPTEARHSVDLADASEMPSLEALVSARAELAQTERARIEELLGDGSRGLRGGAAALGLAWVGSAAEQGELRVEDRAGSPIESVLAELDRSLDEARTIVSDRTRELFDVIVVGSLAKQLQRDVEHMHATVADLNRLLARTELGGVRYAFRVVPRPERAELSSLVRRMSALDPASRVELRSYLEGRRGELGAKGDDPPALLDYRRWFDYRLVTRAATDSSEETPWTRERRAAGSGGEQGVPSHLIVFALAKLTFDAASARAMPLLLDEAFQGIDAGRREGLLAFATELGLQLVVASPDQDGVVASARRTTTLFVVKDEHGDVHLAPYHYWNHAPATQTTLALTPTLSDA
jgi:hypothetical protein